MFRNKYVFMNEETGGEGEVQAAGGGEESSSLLGDKEVTLQEGEYFLSENVKGQGDKPEWFNDGKYKTIADQAKAHSELRKMLGGFTGTPKDGYATPEGFDSEDAALQSFIELATSSNMNQETFDKGFELLQAQMGVTQEVSAEEEFSKLGDNAEQRINTVEQFLRNNAGEDFDSIRDMATTAQSIELMEKMINVLAPKKLPINGGIHPQGLTWEKIEEAMHKKDEATGRLLRSVDPAYNAKVEKMMEEFGGNEPNNIAVG